MHGKNESIGIKTLSEPEWIFIFERVGTIGSQMKGKVKETGINVKGKINIPENSNILDLRSAGPMYRCTMSTVKIFTCTLRHQR